MISIQKSDSPYAFLNDEYRLLTEVSISPLDRGFLFGDGCYGNPPEK